MKRTKAQENFHSQHPMTLELTYYEIGFIEGILKYHPSESSRIILEKIDHQIQESYKKLSEKYKNHATHS